MEENLRKCKRCNKVLDESKFYLKGHYVRGRYYTNYSGRCKTCECEVAQLRRAGLYDKDKLRGKYKMYQTLDMKLKVDNDVSYTATKGTEVADRDLWVIRNLKSYGNCYINSKHNLDRIEQELNCKLVVRTLSDGGYILEVRK